jgi:hypothetical protein
MGIDQNFLQSRDTLSQGIQAPIPVNQGQTDLRNSVSTILAGQRVFINYALTEWAMNDKLHLQSSLNEELGLGTWTRIVGTIPTTKKGETLAVLDLKPDSKHPRWKAVQQAEVLEMRPLLPDTANAGSPTDWTWRPAQFRQHSHSWWGKFRCCWRR